MTLAETIIAAHSGLDEVTAGSLVTAKVDRIYLQDGNSPTISKLFDQHGFTSVFDPERIAVFFDHSVIAPDKHIANRLREAERFARKWGFETFRQGAGISHIVAVDLGWFVPGSLVVGTDSHTCTGGAMQCLALGMGASDVAAAMVTGEVWLRVPETVWLDLRGVPSRIARAKDVMLYVLARFGQDPFLYRSVEWCGDWPRSIGIDGAVTLANMGVEMGAKCVFLPPGNDRTVGMAPIVAPDPSDSRLLVLDIADLPPMIARPHSPLSSVPIDDVRGDKINYVFIGSCTNSRIEDLEDVVSVLRHEPVHPDVYCIITPGSLQVFLEASRRGLIDILMRAGAVVTPPGCSACLGTQGSIPASGDRVLSTMNRNFQGRMGNPDAHIQLASPLVAAHAAVRGEIPGSQELA
ncbi:3-isopropylmalate dehydratase large subunit [Bradyrhizobium japonicum]|uniref:3-isopropylmalate dehydratase large subunit n=1 Tax=Bradyrhizobium japonicum TaxID=375 RepID=UPI00200F5494|nr:aconitase/3-isopropylmalate dehydratase large subunit family protein [Bradyrhizobium japonicum]UQE03624.1 3-isopropylmalate dehydratase large subunit [Bradyrhizobium japonicum]